MTVWMKFIAVIIAFAMWGALGGCASNSVAGWQDAIVEYIEFEGGGDPAALRNLADERGLIEFHHFGPDQGLFKKSRTDMDGVLVGAERIGQHHWLLFLVAEVEYEGGSVDTSWDYPRVQTIRAAALRTDGGVYTWRLGALDDDATAQYLAPQIKTWRANHAADPADPITRFPTERDHFLHTRAGGVITITNENTGASWTIDLAEPE